MFNNNKTAASPHSLIKEIILNLMGTKINK